jgi:hypothetical protein
MVSRELLTQPGISGMFHTAPAVALDADFDIRWVAWVARGRAHEQRVRRRFLVWTGILAMGAACVYVFVRS